jgi:hypothetical protein
MIAALIDNGSLEPAAHRNLRAVAGELGTRTGIPIHAVSWKHSHQIRPEVLGGKPAWTLAPWLRAQYQRGERDFVFIPFFISAQGAIGSFLYRDLEALQQELGDLRFTFTSGLAPNGVLLRIVTARIRETIRKQRLRQPAVVVVDHGGPSPASAALRNQVAAEVRRELGGEISRLAAASLEGAEYAHNQPLFADVLASREFDAGDVVIAPLFLAAGRHAGPRGDLAEIATAAEDRLGAAPLHCHFTGLVGTHPDVVPALAEALTHTVSTSYVAA